VIASRPAGLKSPEIFFDEAVRIFEMLDGVPHSDDIEFSADIDAEIVSLRRIDAAFLSGRLCRNVNTGGRAQPWPRLIEKKPIGAADLGKNEAGEIGRDLLEGRKSTAKVYAPTWLLGDVI
jgi:hypothetical protein